MRSLIFLIVAAVSVLYAEAHYGGGDYGNNAYGNSQSSSAFGSNTHGHSAYGSSGSNYGNNGYGSSGSTRRHHHGNHDAIVAAANKCHRLRLRKMSSGSLADEEEATLSGQQCQKLLPLVDYQICTNIVKKLQSGQTLAGYELQLKPRCREVVAKVKSMMSRHRHGHHHGHGGKYTREQFQSCMKLRQKSKQRIPFTAEEKQFIPLCKKVFAEHNGKVAALCQTLAKARAQGKQVPAKFNRLERACPRILASLRRQQGGNSNYRHGDYGSQTSSYNRNSGHGGHKQRHPWSLTKKSAAPMCSTGYKMNTTENMKMNSKYSRCMVKSTITTAEACASACLKCSHCNTATFISQANVCITCKVFGLPGKKAGPELAACPICTVYQKTCKAKKNPFLTDKKNPTAKKNLFLSSEMKR